MKIADLVWSYRISEPDEEYPGEHRLWAADLLPDARIVVYWPSWSEERDDPLSAAAYFFGTAFICSACIVWNKNLDITQKKYAPKNVGGLIQYMIGQHQENHSQMFYMLIRELPPLQEISQ